MMQILPWAIPLGVFVVLGIWRLSVARYLKKIEERDQEIKELKDGKYEMVSASQIYDAIGLLEAETLLLRHNSGKERSYSFAQVLLAIADQLTIGVSSIHFESRIIKGLGIDERGGWYFPYGDDGITHLIGILTQNALIERHNEEYQHMTREVYSGTTGISITPNAHVVKNTEVKYYLSQSLGSRVVQQLRQESVAHTEDSQTE